MIARTRFISARYVEASFRSVALSQVNAIQTNVVFAVNLGGICRLLTKAVLPGVVGLPAGDRGTQFRDRQSCVGPWIVFPRHSNDAYSLFTACPRIELAVVIRPENLRSSVPARGDVVDRIRHVDSWRSRHTRIVPDRLGCKLNI